MASLALEGAQRRPHTWPYDRLQHHGQLPGQQFADCDALAGRWQFRDRVDVAVDDDHPGQALEDLVRGQRVMVRVIEVRPPGMIVGDRVLVLEPLARFAGRGELAERARLVEPAVEGHSPGVAQGEDLGDRRADAVLLDGRDHDLAQ